LKVWAPIATVVGVTAGLPVSICSTATFEDVLIEYGWIDGAKFPNAALGQFYAISADGSTREPLCEIKDDDVGVVPAPMQGIRIVNGLGQVLPRLPQFALYFGLSSGDSGGYRYELDRLQRKAVPTGSLLYLQTKIFQPRDSKSLTGKAQEEAIRFANCTNAIRVRARDYCVAQMFDLVIDEVTGRPIAVDLQPLCIIVDGAEFKSMPDIDGPSIWTTAKRRLGLVTVEPLTNH
jgi:hypothetical protein